MKAKEYFDKYFANVTDPASKECNKACIDLMIEMSGEIITLCDSRHSRSNSTIDGVIREMNQRFNAVRDMCEKKYGTPILVRNGFKTYWYKQFKKAGV